MPAPAPCASTQQARGRAGPHSRPVTRTVPSVIATGFAADDDTCHSGNPIGAAFANIAHNWPANRQMAANLSGIAARELDPNIGTIAVTCRFHYSHVEKRYD